jgi:hypothetical protein
MEEDFGAYLDGELKLHQKKHKTKPKMYPILIKLGKNTSNEFT